MTKIKTPKTTYMSRHLKSDQLVLQSLCITNNNILSRLITMLCHTFCHITEKCTHHRTQMSPKLVHVSRNKHSKVDLLPPVIVVY